VKVCDYHDLPLVCGECDSRRGALPTLKTGITHHYGKSDAMHRIRPVHRIPDPEAVEGTQVVPCGLA